MSDLNRNLNHSYRNQIGAKKSNIIKLSKKFDDKTEALLIKYFDYSLFST
jgi:hypothetical protein